MRDKHTWFFIAMRVYSLFLLMVLDSIKLFQIELNGISENEFLRYQE